MNNENELSFDCLDAVRNLEHIGMRSNFPNDEDFFGAAQALIRLQDTYELNITDLSRGNLLGRQTHAGDHSFLH